MKIMAQRKRRKILSILFASLNAFHNDDENFEKLMKFKENC